MDYIIQMLGPFYEGSKVTLSLFCITLLLSIPLGLCFTLLKLSKIKLVEGVMDSYIWLMRGTPLLLQILFIYQALPAINIVLSPFQTAVLAFVLNYAAYFAEIFRSGIQSISQGQYEASKALGFTYFQTMRRVILPQMIKRILPPLNNETCTLIKDTSLVYVIALTDIIKVAKSFNNRDFNPTAFFVAGIFFLVITFIITRFFKYLEDRYAVYND